MRIKYSIFFIIFFTFLISCGRKGKPLPPYSNTPATVKELSIKQQGNFIIVIWKYIPSFDDGRPLKEFNFLIYKNGKLIDASINKKGNLYWFKYPVEKFNEMICFYIEVKTKNGKISKPSKNVCITPNNFFPSTPKLKDIKLVEDGLKLEWEADGNKVYIYKGDINGIPPVPLKIIENHQKDGEYIDKSVAHEKEYCYYITTSFGDYPESNPSNIICKTYKDIFPPQPPYDFKMIKRKEGYYLIWSESPSKDVIGYIIFKNGEPLFDIPIKTYYFIDKTYKEGDVYYIIAIDRVGNKSEKVYLKEIIE